VSAGKLKYLRKFATYSITMLSRLEGEPEYDSEVPELTDSDDTDSSQSDSDEECATLQVKLFICKALYECF